MPRGASVLFAQKQMLRTVRHSAEAAGASLERGLPARLQSPAIWYENTCIGGISATALLSAIPGLGLLLVLLRQVGAREGGGRGRTSSPGMVRRA